ncbi:PREDICTED: uncharacterized protein LOC109483309 [Branchiostoma belcheri]|uniref:Uncharacterized protein LOC109483309 n=1 Tax=Branchiostoma belcheri TaxID=7741 RepID=A0A6P4ZKX5_BRABE|nr:PREDICTED: uncharacterized protein LOC109483309 [Branchiostoma belcheri]
MDRIIAQDFATFFQPVQVILAATALCLFHHRKHLQTLIWRPYVLLLFGLGTVFLLRNTSKLLRFAAWLFFVCLHYFKDLQKGNESECPICFEDFKTSCPYECTRCKKATHARCVVEYLERRGEESFRCPFCRKDLRVKKEELKLFIERFEKLMGDEDTNERLENETAEDQPTTAPEKRQGKLLSLLTALKTATLVSLMVTFYGSYQLFTDSYRALPGDLKTFVGVLFESIRSAIVEMWNSQLLRDVLNALWNVIGALHECVTVLGVNVYNNLLLPLVRLGVNLLLPLEQILCDTCWLFSKLCTK